MSVRNQIDTFKRDTLQSPFVWLRRKGLYELPGSCDRRRRTSTRPLMKLKRALLLLRMN